MILLFLVAMVGLVLGAVLGFSVSVHLGKDLLERQSSRIHELEIEAVSARLLIAELNDQIKGKP